MEKYNQNGLQPLSMNLSHTHTHFIGTKEGIMGNNNTSYTNVHAQLGAL